MAPALRGLKGNGVADAWSSRAVFGLLTIVWASVVPGRRSICFLPPFCFELGGRFNTGAAALETAAAPALLFLLEAVEQAKLTDLVIDGMGESSLFLLAAAGTGELFRFGVLVAMGEPPWMTTGVSEPPNSLADFSLREEVLLKASTVRLSFGLAGSFLSVYTELFELARIGSVIGNVSP